VVKHIEMNVIRDEQGRVLRSETHEWDEAPATVTKHLSAAQGQLGSARDQRAEVSELKQRIADLRTEHEQEIAELKNRHLHTVSSASDLSDALVEDRIAAAREAGYKQGRYEAVTIANEIHKDLMQIEKEEGR